ncbi:hypothetical protein [Radiobacillus sp. PE A8.2]|uniref:hypothetical protein n=1 Tax=Radiobacillus sp. PE A8.2 TaxID=3380349 RepID=UPI003890C1D9
MSQLNNQTFPEGVQEYLEYILGVMMESPGNQEWLKRAGKKGGSTRYILTDTLFAEDKKGHKYEMAIFSMSLDLLNHKSSWLVLMNLN